MGKLLLIDGNAVLHRAYYALPDWRNRSGEATAGVYGFLSILAKAIEELKPSHLVVVFDCPEPTFRHTMYVGYQTNREKDRQISEDIWGQVEKLKIVFEKMEVPVFAVPGFEADDVIGTLAVQITNHKSQITNKSQNSNSNNQTEVVIITGDRDLMQLVNDQVKLFMPIRGVSDMVIIDEEKVVERLGVKPWQVVDYKALVGDSSDNYPGVAGIGPKTAIGLLEKFTTVENLYAAITPQTKDNSLNSSLKSQVEDLGLKLRLKLIEGYEAAMLSQKLAQIRLDVPLTFKLEKAGVPDTEKMAGVLKELGYKSLVKRMTGEEMKEDNNQQKLFE